MKLTIEKIYTNSAYDSKIVIPFKKFKVTTVKLDCMDSQNKICECLEDHFQLLIYDFIFENFNNVLYDIKKIQEINLNHNIVTYKHVYITFYEDEYSGMSVEKKLLKLKLEQ